MDVKKRLLAITAAALLALAPAGVADAKSGKGRGKDRSHAHGSVKHHSPGVHGAGRRVH
jgi:hypothetical protein